VLLLLGSERKVDVGIFQLPVGGAGRLTS
jgi:hypothetical protein